MNDLTKLDTASLALDKKQPELNIKNKELALKIKRVVGFKGEIVFDSTKPDGIMRKLTDISLLHKLGYHHKFDLNSGLKETYSNYLK